METQLEADGGEQSHRSVIAEDLFQKVDERRKLIAEILARAENTNVAGRRMATA